jgi:hypothetical protein
MMSMAAIQDLSRKVAAEAAANDRVPFVVEQEDIDTWVDVWNGEDKLPRLPFPALGDYIPEGWVLVDEMLVDKTGWGQSGEPALTVGEMLVRLEAGFGYGLREEGQFQIYVGKFERV